MSGGIAAFSGSIVHVRVSGIGRRYFHNFRLAVRKTFWAETLSALASAKSACRNGHVFTDTESLNSQENAMTMRKRPGNNLTEEVKSKAED